MAIEATQAFLGNGVGRSQMNVNNLANEMLVASAVRTVMADTSEQERSYIRDIGPELIALLHGYCCLR